jgi:sec-independent protein translocase protein TatA
MGPLRPWHILILVAVLILLFGAKRLPGAARSLGRSMRIIKAETRGLVDEPEPDDLDDKAEAQSGRRPLAKEQKSEAQSGEVLDPPAERVRDN